MRNKKTLCVTLTSMVILIVGAAFGQESSGYSYQKSPSTPADLTFVIHAAPSGMAEVKLGQLAEEKASSEAVKDFGKRMVADHSKAITELENIAVKDNIQLPKGLDKKDQTTYDRLASLSGPAFDRAYMRDMVTDHEKDVSEFKREAKSGNDSDVKSFASASVPTLENHLEQARSIEHDIEAYTGLVDKNGNPISGN